ncbi:hypothetical protein [Geoglobus acetivorans]
MGPESKEVISKALPVRADVYNGTLTVYYRNGEKKVLTFYGGSP